MKTVCRDAVSQSIINDMNITTALLHLVILRVLLSPDPYYSLESCILIQVLLRHAIYSGNLLPAIVPKTSVSISGGRPTKGSNVAIL